MGLRDRLIALRLKRRKSSSESDKAVGEVFVKPSEVSKLNESSRQQAVVVSSSSPTSSSSSRRSSGSSSPQTQSIKQEVASSGGGKLQLTQASKSARQQEQARQVVAQASKQQGRFSNLAQERTKFQDTTLRTARNILTFPEKKIIEPTLQRIRETEGTDIVVTRRGFEMEASARIGRRPFTRTGFQIGDTEIQPNIAGAIDIASFLTPVRQTTFSVSALGEVLYNPNYARQNPIEVGSAFLVGGSKVAGDISKISKQVVASDLKALSNVKFKGVGEFTGESNIIGNPNLRVGLERGTKNIRQFFSGEGSATRVPSNAEDIARTYVQGRGFIITQGETSTVLGVPRKIINQVQEIRFGTSGASKQAGQRGGVTFSEAVSFGGSSSSEGQRVLSLDTMKIISGKRVSFTSSQSGDVAVFDLIKPSGTGASSSSSRILSEGSSRNIKVENLDFAGEVSKKASVSISEVSPQVPKIPDISGFSPSRTETITQTRTQATNLPAVVTSDPIQDTISSSGNRTGSRGRSRSRSNSTQGTINVPQSITTPATTSITRTPTRAITPTTTSIITSTPFFPRITPPIPTRTIKRPPMIPFFRVRRSNSFKAPRGITTEVRRFGKFKGVGSVFAGQSIVTGTLGATFRVRGKGAKKIKTPKGFRRKATPEGIEFIEKRKFRLSKKGEKIEIQKARRIK